MGVTLRIRYNGCDDPLAFLDAESERFNGHAGSCGAASLEEFFGRLEAGDVKMADPVGIIREYGSFGAYKAALLAARDRDEGKLGMAGCFGRMSLRAMLSLMPGVRHGEPVPEDVVRGVRDEAMARYGVALADDYIAYLSACGRVAVHGVELSGIDPSGEYDVLVNIGEVRAETGISGRYYPLCWFESERTATVAYFQDASGIVYALDRDLVLEPEFRSLQEFLAAFWLRTQGEDE